MRSSVLRWSCPYWRRVRRKFRVSHRPSRLAGMEIRLLLWLQRSAGMLLHRRHFLLVSQLGRRWWSLGHQCRPTRRWTTSRLVRGRSRARNRGRWLVTRRFRNISRSRRPISRRLRNIMLSRRWCGLPCCCNVLIRTDVSVRRNPCRGRRLTRMSYHWCMLHDGGPLRSYRWVRCCGACRYRFSSGIDLGMRDDLSVLKLLWVDLDYVALYRLRVTKGIRRNGRGCHGLVAVVNIVDVCDINVRDVDVAHVGYVYLAQVIAAVVIPRIEGLARTQREPRRYSANPKTDGETSTADEGHESWAINRRNRNRSRQPTPPYSYLHPASVVKRRESPGSSVNPSPAPGLDPGPAAIAVGAPANRYPRRIPDRAIGRDRVSRFHSRRDRNIPAHRG